MSGYNSIDQDPVTQNLYVDSIFSYSYCIPTPMQSLHLENLTTQYAS